VVLGYFVACGVSRLARYNVTAENLADGTGKVKYFEGTPIPTSAVLVCVMMIAAYLDAIGGRLWFGAISIAGYLLHPLVLVYGISGSLMISRVRIPKL
jgi:CDP-diacylglycerol--serine O-phosphatidyltransferase